MQPNAIRKHILAHWFGCGLVPRAPGTVGTLGAIPVHWLLTKVSIFPHALVVLSITLVGFVVAQLAAKAVGDEDPGAVVIDEVAGMLIAGWFVRDRGWPLLAVAFVLFRLLDITKPGIIDRAQRVGPPGVSIMLDDILAGLGAGMLSWLCGFALNL